MLWMILFISYPIFAADTINGDLSAFLLSKTGSPYKVTDDIFIPEGKKVVIPAGIVLLFSDFTGLKVDGILSVEGTEKDPVVFSSIYDNDYGSIASRLPNPDDWNGMLVTAKSSGVVLGNFILKYSASGITSQISNVRIVNGHFAQNSKNVMIENNLIPIVENEVCNYPSKEKILGQDGMADSSANTVSQKPIVVSPNAAHLDSIGRPCAVVSSSIAVQKKWWKRMEFRLPLATAGFFGFASGALCYFDANTRLKHIKQYENSPDQSLSLQEQSTRKKSIKDGILYGGIGICSALGLGLTFIF
jgi:hypothetical protein